MGLVNGRPSEQISGQRRRRPYRDEPDKFFDRARPLFFSALQRARDRSLRDREFILQRCSLWPTALRDARYYLGLSSHLYLLDDSEEPDRSERSRDIFFSRFYLCDEPGAFKRLARDRIAANYLCQFWRRSGRKFAQFFGMGRQFDESVYAGSWRAGELAESMRQRMSLWLGGAQAACLRCLAALPNTTSSASCRRLQAGSLRFPDPLATRKRPEICCWFFLNRPCMFRRINNCPLCSR